MPKRILPLLTDWEKEWLIQMGDVYADWRRTYFRKDSEQRYARNQLMFASWIAGTPMKILACRYCVSYERVRQICYKILRKIRNSPPVNFRVHW